MSQAFLPRFFETSVLLLSLMAADRAYSQHWGVTTTGNWSEASNWMQNYVPTTGGYTYVINGGMAQLTGNGAAGFLYVSGGSTLEITGSGNLTANAPAGVGQMLGGSGGGTLSISGSSAKASLTNSLGYFSVGSGGNGVVNLSDGGTLTLNGGSGSMEMANSGSATLNIGTGGAAGILNAASIDVVNASSTVNFNHTDASYHFTGNGASSGTGVAINGGTRVFHLGNGLTTLTAASTYTGGTTLNAGILSVAQDNNLGASTGTLTFDGGTLQTTDTFTMNRATTLTGNGTFETAAATTLTQQGIISGAGALVKTGTGMLTLSGSNTYAGGTIVKTGTVTMGTGGAITHAAADLRVGDASGDNGTLTINGGTVTNGDGIISNGSESSGAVTVTSGTWTNMGRLQVGYFGNGSLTISGGYVSNTRGTIAYAGGIRGEVIVTGGTWANSQQLLIGGGSGSLLINGGTVTSSYGRIGVGIDSDGIATVTSGSWTMGGLLSVGALLNSNGTLLINGGSVSSGTGLVGGNAAATGTATVSSGTWTTTGDIAVGAAGTGTLNLTGGTVSVNAGAGVLQLGRDATATGTLNIGTGGTVGTLTAASVTGGSGLATVNLNHTGSLTFAPALLGNLSVNKLGAGKTILTGTNTYTGPTTINGGILSVSSNANLGAAAGGLIFNGGTLQSTGSFTMNRETTLNGTATFNIDAGTALTQQGAIGGAGSLVKTGTGTLILTGSNSYNANLSIEGGIVSVNSDNAIGAGGITLEGGALLGSASFTTNRTVNLSDGGGSLMAVNGETVTFTRDFNDLNGGNGLTIGSATHTGTIVLTGTTPHTGATNVAGGTLVANGLFSGTSAVTVQSGATLSGTGTITGNVEIANGGTLATGNSPGTLTVGNLTLNELSTSHFELNTPGVIGGGVNDLVAVTGNLTLDGIANLSTGSLLTSGTYTLFTYGGTLTDNGLLFGRGHAGYNFTFATGNNAVNIVVGYDGIQWWDGTQTDPDGMVHGGSGTWDDSTANWTNENGNANNGWAGLVARFSGTAGTISVASDVEIGGLQFETDGYLLSDGGGSLIISGSKAEIFVNPDATAEIAVLLSGSGGILKNGGGTVVLTGSNNFKGGTTLSRGTLEIASDFSLGASTGGIAFNGGTLRTTTSITSSRQVTLESQGEFETTSGTLTLTGAVTGTGGFVKSDTGSLVLSGSLGYQGVTQVNAGTLEFQADTSALSGNLVNNSAVIFNQSADSAYSGIVSGSGTLTKNGAALLDLTGSTLTHSGVTTVNAGTLAAGSLSNSALNLVGGVFSPGGKDIIANITVAGLTLNGGSFVFDLGAGGTSDSITVANGAATLNAITLFTFNDLEAASGMYHLMSGLTPGWNLDLLDYEGVTNGTGTFILNSNGTDLYFSIHDGGIVTGPVLQNSVPIGTPTKAKFFVSGTVTTGTAGESNTVNSLTFEDESSLLVHNTLTVTSGSVAVVNGTASLTGSQVNTPGDFTKTGVGKLISDIVLQVGGATNIQSGQLVINGTLSAPGGVVLLPNGVLGGSGVIDGNLINHGTLSPGNSPGTLTVAGDYVQTGTFLMEIGGKNDFDRLIVAGRATLSGDLIVVPYYGYGIEYGQKFTFIKAAKISGAFDKTILPDGFRGRILQEKDNTTLLVAPESYVQVAITPNQKNAARALDYYISATGDDRETVSIALDHLKADEYPDAFNQIAPTFYESLASITVEQSNTQGQMLQQRFGAASLAPRGFTQSGLELPIVAEGKTRSGKDLKEFRDIMEASASNPWSVWIQGNGLFAKSSSISNIPNYRFDSGGLLLGADYHWNDQFVTGLYAGYQGTRARYDGGGHTDIDAARFGGYATYNARNGFYANALAGGGHSRYDVRRPIDFGTVDRTARSTPSGNEFSAMLGTGYDWKAGDFTFGPVASAQYTYVTIDGFSETGAKSLDLRLDDQAVHSLRSTLGARIAYTWQLSPDVTLIPELRATWQHEFLQGSETLSAALDGGSAPIFHHATATPERDALFAGMGLNLLFGNRWSANVYYNADCASGDFKSQMVSGGVSIKF